MGRWMAQPGDINPVLASGRGMECQKAASGKGGDTARWGLGWGLGCAHARVSWAVWHTELSGGGWGD